MVALCVMNRIQRFHSGRRLSLPTIPPSCFLYQRLFSTLGTDASSESLPSSNQNIQLPKGGSFNKSTSTTSSLNEHELAKFSAIADTWWHSEGPFKPLHLMNPTRLAFIRSTLCRHFSKDPSSARPFEGLRLIDVGCGGGLLSEPLARMGATVTGIDAVDKNVKIARLHAYDAVLALEVCQTFTDASTVTFIASKFILMCKFSESSTMKVIEHVANPEEFCKSLSALTIPDGATIISTINRSVRSYASAIVVAEYILHWLPKGTHQWSSFLTPEQVTMILERASVDVKEMAGFVYNPITGRWLLSDNICVNFIAYGTKRK
ncbi:unnamed protein product [Cochlearia groenlandica]